MDHKGMLIIHRLARRERARSLPEVRAIGAEAATFTGGSEAA
jgi:hypothetical protein